MAIKSPLIGWLGGKWQLGKVIVPLLCEHECYVEPFAGGAAVLFRKEPSTVEVLNDLNVDVVTLYRVVQYHLEEFCRWYKWVLVSRDEYERWLNVEPETLTDVQRAVRFYCLHRMSFGGRLTSPTFGCSATRPPRLNLLRIEEDLSAAHLRLSRVLIERRPYEDVIGRYDRPGTLFYVDPPYYGKEEFYGKGLFARDDFERLRGVLAGIAGKFILSLNDVPEVRAIFGRFRIEEVTCRYSVGKSKEGGERAKEVLILNY